MSATAINTYSFLAGTARVQPVTLAEAMEALCELRDSGYGRSLPNFDEARETRARLKVCDLQERYLLAGGAK